MSTQQAPSQPTRDKVGIQSELTDVFRSDSGRAIVRARFRVDNATTPLDQQFQPGDWLEVAIRARVYDPDSVGARMALPEKPRAEGPEEKRTARTEWTAVDLELPPMPRGDYIVVAKVYSVDPTYRRPFDPSNCFAFRVDYGFKI